MTRRSRSGDRVLGQRALQRALLARQLLLERSPSTIASAFEQVGGLQTQYAPSGYVGLWTRLQRFERDSLTRALEERTVIQATLLRTTIHMVSRREFWRYALGVRESRRAWSRRVAGAGSGSAGGAASNEAGLIAAAERLRGDLADGPKTVKELGTSGFVGTMGLWVDLVRVPPSGTWDHRRADRLALAEQWVGSPDATEAEGLAHLVRAYLRAFGPAPWADIASWAGIRVDEAKRGAEALTLVSFRDEDGRGLVDLPDQPLPDPDTPAPVRFLPHWDASLLVHARRTGLLPEPMRPRVFSTRNPFSVGTYLVDGSVAGGWSVRDGAVVLDPYRALNAADQAEVEGERDALQAFMA